MLNLDCPSAPDEVTYLVSERQTLVGEIDHMRKCMADFPPRSRSAARCSMRSTWCSGGTGSTSMPRMCRAFNAFHKVVLRQLNHLKKRGAIERIEMPEAPSAETARWRVVQNDQTQETDRTKIAKLK